jgi:hypothetical protein
MFWQATMLSFHLFRTSLIYASLVGKSHQFLLTSKDTFNFVEVRLPKRAHSNIDSWCAVHIRVGTSTSQRVPYAKTPSRDFSTHVWRRQVTDQAQLYLKTRMLIWYLTASYSPLAVLLTSSFAWREFWLGGHSQFKVTMDGAP